MSSKPQTRSVTARERQICDNCEQKKNMATADDLKKLSEKFEKLLKSSLDTMHESIQSNKDQTTKNLDALENAIDHMQPQGLPGATRSAPVFSGNGDDPSNFLERFRLYAQLYKWSDEQSFLAFPLSLVGNAQTWYAILDKSKMKSLDDLIKAFKAQFLSHTDDWALRQELAQRRQAEREPLSDYITDIRKRCQRLAIPPIEQLHFFINGLRPALRDYVILQQPKTLEDAERYAKIKNSIQDNPLSAATAVEILSAQRDLIEELKKQSQNNSQIAAFNQNLDQTPQRPNYRPQPQNFRYPRPRFTQPGNSYTPRPNFNSRGDFGRSIRTTQGQIICSRCNRVGHHFRNCRAQLPNSARFSRPPPRNSQTFPVRSANRAQPRNRSSN